MNYKKLTRVADSHIADNLNMDEYDAIKDDLYLVFQKIQQEVASLVVSIAKDGMTVRTPLAFHDAINDGYEEAMRRIAKFLKVATGNNHDDDYSYEPDDWYERFDHGDFDNLN